MFKKIIVDRFRALKHLEINDFQQFNLVVGKNNCGKTALLEALYLSINPSNPALPEKINLWKELNLLDPNIWNTLFYGLDFNSNIKIFNEFVNPKEIREITIKPNIKTSPIRYTYKMRFENGSELMAKDSSSAVLTAIHGVNIDFFYKDSKGNKSKIFSSSITNKELKREIQENLNMGISTFKPFEIKMPKDYNCPSNGRFLNPRTIRGQIIQDFNQIVLKKEKSVIVDILKEIDKNIQGLEMIKDEIYVDLGFYELAPLNIIGDGLLNLLVIVLSIYNQQNGILLIDEIENGLHYSIQKVLWKYIFKYAKRFNVQIIATTHSFDCIRAFKEVYFAEEVNDDNIRLFRIERNKNDEFKITKYDKNSLKFFVDKEWETR